MNDAPKHRYARGYTRQLKTTAKQNPAVGNTYHIPSAMLAIYVGSIQVCPQRVTVRAEAMALDDTYQMDDIMLARPPRGRLPQRLTRQTATGEQPDGRITRQLIPEGIGPMRSLELIQGVEQAAEAPPLLPPRLKQAAETLHHKLQAVGWQSFKQWRASKMQEARAAARRRQQLKTEGVQPLHPQGSEVIGETTPTTANMDDGRHQPRAQAILRQPDQRTASVRHH